MGKAEQRKARESMPEAEQPYQIPDNWQWVRLGAVCGHISDGSHNPPIDAGHGIPLLSAINIHDRLIDIDGATRWITEEEWKLENQRTRIEVGDVLITIVGSIGRVAVVETNERFALQRSVAALKPTINPDYLS